MNICSSDIDWVATGTMLQGVATLLGAIAVLVAARMGANTFQAWKRQKLTERHIDQAERILTAAYQARRALSYVRGRMMWAHELNAAEQTLEENPVWKAQPPDRQKRLVTVQAYYNRINRTKDEREALDHCLPMARALFGEDLEKSIESLNRQFWLVQVDVDSYADDDGSDEEFAKKIRRGMYEIEPRSGEKNEITEAVETAVNAIEGFCLPVLRVDVT